MTAEQVLGIADTLATAVEPKPVEAAPSAPTVADDDYITGKELKAMLASAGAGATELAASANLGLVRQEHAQDFAQYGAEITALVQRVPPAQRTLDNLRQVVRMVRSDHLDEIVEQRASQRASAMAPTLRSTGGSAELPPVAREYSLESEKIPAEWKRRALAAGVTERVVDEFCRANDMTPEAFYKQFDKPLSRIVEDIPQRRQA